MRYIKDIIILVCKYLNKNNIPYVLIGGVTLPLIGTPRTTADVDIMINILTKDVPKFIEFLKKNDFITEEWDMKSALKEKSHCSVLDNKSPFRVDIKGIYSELDGSILKRRMSFDYYDTKIWIWSPEDAIALKLFSGSEQDIKDAKSVYVRQLPSLDIEYLIGACKKLDVLKKFEKMKRDVENYLKEF